LGGFLGDQIEVVALGDFRVDNASGLRILLVAGVELGAHSFVREYEDEVDFLLAGFDGLQELCDFDIDNDLLLAIAGSIPENHNVDRVHSTITLSELSDGLLSQSLEARAEFTRGEVLRMVSTELWVNC
jgi:hypothetical protein